MKPAALGSMVAVALLLTQGRWARGELFVLTGGGRVSGEWLNPDELPREKYVIKASVGGRITLDKSQVKEVLQIRPQRLEYEKIRPNYPDTVEAQWELAEWCRQQRLSQQRDRHLGRVVELDPDHAQARRALGYTQVEGKWAMQDELMIARGFQRYNGRWRTSQEIELLEKHRKTELAEKEWAQRLRRWRNWLGTDRDGNGRRNILAIDDPHAVAALARALQSDRFQVARILYVEALAKIGTPQAVKTLATRSLEDPIEEVRLTCLDYLEKQKHPDVVGYFVGKLGDKDNRVINLAAVGLRRMKDPSAIGPLIDALVTTHKFTIGSGNPGSISTTFGTGPGGSGGSGLSMGGGPKIIVQPIPNQSVLDALVTITGANFDYDQRAWKYWYASQRRRVTLDARRD